MLVLGHVCDSSVYKLKLRFALFHWQEAAWTTCSELRTAFYLSSSAGAAKEEAGRVRTLPRVEPEPLKVSIWGNWGSFSTRAMSPPWCLELPWTVIVCLTSLLFLKASICRGDLVIFCCCSLCECEGGFFSFWLGVSTHGISYENMAQVPDDDLDTPAWREWWWPSGQGWACLT